MSQGFERLCNSLAALVEHLLSETQQSSTPGDTVVKAAEAPGNGQQWIMPEKSSGRGRPKGSTNRVVDQVEQAPSSPPLIEQDFDDLFDISKPTATSAVMTLDGVKTEVAAAYEAAEDKSAFQTAFIKCLNAFGAKALKDVPAKKYGDLLYEVARI